MSSLEDLQFNDLRRLARERGLASSGTKRVLIQRLMDDDGGARPDDVSEYESGSQSSGEEEEGGAEEESGSEEAEVQESEVENDDDGDDESAVRAPLDLDRLDEEEERASMAWLATTRSILNLLLLVEFLTLVFIEWSSSELPLKKFLMTTLTLRNRELYSDIFGWFSFLIALPMFFSVFWNSEEKRGGSFSVLAFSAVRFAIVYLFGETVPSLVAVFARLPVRLFNVTCALTTVLAFWDALTNPQIVLVETQLVPNDDEEE